MPLMATMDEKYFDITMFMTRIGAKAINDQLSNIEMSVCCSWHLSENLKIGNEPHTNKS